jgi:short-subunit dehydrogenase
VKLKPGMTAIVTGASRGIGRALAVELASRGLRIGLLARDREALEKAAGALPGDDHIVLAADVAKRREIERAIERFAKRAEGLDLLAANAGIAHYGPFSETDVERAEEMVKVNVLGTIYAVHAALPHLLERLRGHIVVTSSGAGLRAFPEAAVYGATKAAERGFAEALRHELAGTGLSVTTVYPGEVATDLHAHERDILPDWRSNDEELPPAEVATAIVAAIEGDRREVSVPKIVRLLGLNGLSPRLVDEVLVRIRGRSAAPRRG